MGTPVVLGDRVLVTTTTTGTGTYQLGSAVTGFLTPALAGISTGARMPFVVVDSLTAPTAFEVGEGIYTSGSPATLARTQIRRNTSGGTSAINWGAGTKYILLAPSAANLPAYDTDGLLAAATATAGTNDTTVATTAFVQTAVVPKAPIASPTFTGTPAAPTAAGATNTTQLATTAFVRAQIPAEFTGANQSFAATGYQKLPGGLILQWTNITIGSGGSTWTFPTAFPTACYFVGGNPAGASVAFADTLWVGTLSASQVALDFLNTNINNAYVFALGR